MQAMNSAHDVLDCFVNEVALNNRCSPVMIQDTIDPDCSILVDPVKMCRFATASAILFQSKDNCTIAWIPNGTTPS